ncbi:hypothetical protein RclHR1_14390004 [Rhizophagus clarus]|uniref:Uncharacterized protein n=1 Tax=Rhizophagus clarus TaxID=94130 RepID=A0A2Z6QS17_9GLOM|nr:hypothetical protein RclHR1_14390004 [Rhizophagus clarus]GES88152.1 hypothetical protein GLOIN_2v1474275 [Rhizophagus clarus]
MEIVNNYYNELNILKAKDLSLKKPLTTKLDILHDILENSEETEENWVKQKDDIKGASKHISLIVEQKNEIINDIFPLTESALELLKRKEILQYRDKVGDFNNEVEKRLGFQSWKEISTIFNRKINTNKNFRREDEKYLTELKKVLEKVNIDLTEFELLFRLKRTSNFEFHQDKEKTLDQEINDLEISFPKALKYYKSPLRKLLLALRMWYN